MTPNGFLGTIVPIFMILCRSFMMHVDFSPQALLAQLGYTQTEQNLKQIQTILEKTEGIEKFIQHLPSFHDALAVEKGFIALSNSKDAFKIKCHPDAQAKNLEAFHTLVSHWQKKYKLHLEAVEGKPLYYLLGA